MRIAIVLVATLALAPAANARVIRIEIATRESPTFGGYSFGSVGRYEKIAGRAFGELDPNDPKNARIVDLQLAPRNARGRVEYSFDFYIVKPIDPSKGARKAMYYAPNRGNKGRGFNRALGGNDPGSVVDPVELSEAFLQQRGYTVIWSSWDASAPKAPFSSTITLPVARNHDGSPVTGPAYEYIDSARESYRLHYPAATTDRTKATLTRRVHLDDAPKPVPPDGWTFNADGTAISLLPAGTRFTADDIYEFSYVARDPTVNGIGFAAIRDFVAFLRYEKVDSTGTANPLAGDLTRVYSFASSQPARMLNDFRTLGFNQAENGRIVFDGMLQWLGAGSGINMNYRFSQPGRTERNRQDRLYAEGMFPFANQTLPDPISGRTAGRYEACTKTSTCPLAMEVFTSNEYWVKGASLMHTNTKGTMDLPDHPKARVYLISSDQHGGLAMKCQAPPNPLDEEPVLRALWEALDQWSTKGIAPPPTMVPRVADGTLVPALPRERVGFPKIPGIVYTGLKTTRYLFDYGAEFYKTGIMTTNPPVVAAPWSDNPKNGPIYSTFVPKTDADGNDLAGVRLPQVAAPLATYTGWGLRSGAYAGDGCEGVGQMIPFPKTKADRVATGDPRQSVEERYASLDAYTEKAKEAIDRLVAKRLMLAEDRQPTLERLVNAARATGAFKDTGQR